MNATIGDWNDQQVSSGTSPGPPPGRYESVPGQRGAEEFQESQQRDPHQHSLAHGSTAGEGCRLMSWRNVLKIHPAADLFPMMTADELKALGEDIKKNGLRVPV